MKQSEDSEIGFREFYPGLLTATALILYFLVMRISGLASHTELRLFNFILMFGGIYLSMRRAEYSSRNDFFWRLGNGVLTAFIASFIFTFFMYMWLYYDHALMEQLKHVTMIGTTITPGYAAAIVLGEGLSSGVIVSYIFLAYTDHGSKSTKEHGFGHD